MLKKILLTGFFAFLSLVSFSQVEQSESTFPFEIIDNRLSLSMHVGLYIESDLDQPGVLLSALLYRAVRIDDSEFGVFVGYQGFGENHGLAVGYSLGGYMNNFYIGSELSMLNKFGNQDTYGRFEAFIGMELAYAFKIKSDIPNARISLKMHSGIIHLSGVSLGMNYALTRKPYYRK